MAVDLYVGTLSRYYRGDWENVGQRYARENNIPYRIVRPDDSDADEAARANPEVLRDAIREWRDVLTDQLANHLAEPLDWDESQEAPYFTDRPHWDGYAGLLLLATHEEHPEFDPPETIVPEWSESPAFQASRANDFAETEYLHVIAPELWLPCHFPFTFRFMDLAGHEMYIGSAYRLLEQLHILNERTFKGNDDDRLAWRGAAPEPGGSFEAAAKYGLAVFLDLAEQAIAHRLPVKLDY